MTYKRARRYLLAVVGQVTDALTSERVSMREMFSRKTRVCGTWVMVMHDKIMNDTMIVM